MKKLWVKDVKFAKRDSWRKFCQEVSGIKGASDIAKYLKSKSLPGNCTLETEGGFTKNEEETLNLLLKTHFPNHAGEMESRQGELNSAYLPLPSYPDHTAEVIDFFSYKRVESAFKKFKDYKSPGVDGIYPIMIKKTFDIVGEFLVNLFKDCIKTCYVPKSWRKSKVVFIPKVGKTDYSNPKNFRPISLMSFLLKGLERVILWYLEEDTLKGRLLHKNLFAYRAGRSTETALHCITHSIEKGLSIRKSHVVAVFLDIDAAFSKASINSMTRTLTGTQCNPALSSWIEFMLRNREVISSWGGSSASLTVTKGTPQGGILSPVLWNLMMNELLNKFDRYKLCEIFCYADDLAIVVSGIDLNTVLSLVQQAINRLVDLTGLRTMS